jgi:SAM-dependent methyltransferase
MKWRIKTFEGSMREIEGVIGRTSGRILDVGAAAGAFVKAAADRGWTAYGIEPCKFLVDWGKRNLGLGRHLSAGIIDDVENGKFDVITLWDVIEHTTDPNKTMEEVCKRLDKRGYVVLNIPDISALVPVLMGKNWPFYESAHLYYFTPDTLDRLMLKHDLHRVYKSKYYQGLSLGYLSYRISQFSKVASGMMVELVKALGLTEVPIKYWIGQTLLIYRHEGRGINNAKKNKAS